MARLHGGTRGIAAFRNTTKRASACHNNTKLLEWIKTYRDMVAPSTATLRLEAAIEFANSSTSLGQTDWGALARRAHSWWTCKKGSLVSAHVLGPPHPRMRRLETRRLQVWAAANSRR